MIFDPYVWFKPDWIIHCCHAAARHYSVSNKKPSSELAKLISEAQTTALFCFGFNLLYHKEHRMQLVNPDEQSPDTRVMYEVPQENGNKALEYYDIEVVEKIEKDTTPEGIADFILRTKFAKDKSYDNKTTILCGIYKNIEAESAKAINEHLLNAGVKEHSVFILGAVDDNTYRLLRVAPTIDHDIVFDMLVEAKKPYINDSRVLFGANSYRRPKTQKNGILNPFMDS
jgi:hypothetical protein